MKVIEDDTNKWKDIPCSWIRKINIVEMNLLPREVYRFSAILMKIPIAYLAFFTELEQIILKFPCKYKRP